MIFNTIQEKTEYYCVWYSICDSYYIWMLVVAVELNPGPVGVHYQRELIWSTSTDGANYEQPEWRVAFFSSYLHHRGFPSSLSLLELNKKHMCFRRNLTLSLVLSQYAFLFAFSLCYGKRSGPWVPLWKIFDAVLINISTWWPFFFDVTFIWEVTMILPPNFN